ncbi:LysR substrate-binding domain-containing protein [Paroceanicella profunda]|uniref:LysR substrate-binding domain-containing protein n=1 Tax=Paroceanicella profunda TaxID=2579971 RepID=UPI00110BDF81|nr:LysR substrate-binding domain-containing protein [Paroceanicella profunda]
MTAAALREQFINGMSRAACTVNVVTTDGPAGRGGVTVSAMSSVSADTPRPTLLVCVNRTASAAAAILENGVFCVNVLRDDQSYISDTFAGRFRDRHPDKFSCAEWVTMASGAPRVRDPLVAFDCKVISSELVGTHHVLFGEVGDLFVAESGSPLLYAGRSYGAASRIDSIERAGLEAKTQLSVACFHSFGPHVLPQLIAKLTRAPEPVHVNIIEGDQRRIREALISGEAEIGLTYADDIAEDLAWEPLTELAPYVLLPEGHLLTEKREITPQDLASEPMVLLDGTPSRDYFPDILRAAGVEPRIGWRSASFETVRGLVGQGLGYALLATRPAAPVSYDGSRLAIRPLACDAPPSRIVFATRRGARLSPAAEEFAWMARDAFTLDV